jgi:hypothetical protein
MAASLHSTEIRIWCCTLYCLNYVVITVYPNMQYSSKSSAITLWLASGKRFTAGHLQYRHSYTSAFKTCGNTSAISSWLSHSICSMGNHFIGLFFLIICKPCRNMKCVSSKQERENLVLKGLKLRWYTFVIDGYFQITSSLFAYPWPEINSL